MGFKRTSEGRVFFSGGEESANDRTGQGPKQKSAGRLQSQQLQIQILGLLKGLNDKLKNNQAERKQMRKELEGYKRIIEELEEKAEHSDQAYQELMSQLSERTTEGRAVQAEKIARETLSELSETRKLLLDLEDRSERTDRNISALKDVQKEQALKMAKATAGYAQITKRVTDAEGKQEDLDNKIEDTISQQARLVRKIDKSIEDRARFMRKIERIEETVIQTRDSLNAKAMVLLTDQAAQAQVVLEDPDADGLDHMEEPVLLSHKVGGASDQAASGFRMSAMTAAVMLIGFVLGGFLIGQLYSGNYIKDISTSMVAAPEVAQSIERSEAPPPSSELQAPTSPGWTIQEDTTAFTEQAIKARGQLSEEQAAKMDQVIETVNDIGAVTLASDEELLALLEEDSGQVGGTMNTIKPGTDQQIIFAEEQPPSAVEPVAEEKPVEVAPAPAVSDAEKMRIAEDSVRPPFVPDPPKAKNILSSVRPDSGLPPMIQKIEQQAFNGVPEAQHDLAAVYISGHAGVKQDYSRAAYWFKQAADQGIANGAYNLGVLNHQGFGIDQDIDEAIRWYHRAAELDHPEARYNLGIAYIEGIGVPYDPARATEYFKVAAGRGILEAAYNLGLIYENGLLGAPAPDEALVWYKTAADAGSQEAKAALEQLARSLDIKIEDINKLAESIKPAAGDVTPKAAPAKPKPVQNPQPTQAAPSEEDDFSAMEFPEEQFEQEQSIQVTIAQIQELLMQEGLYPGPADGLDGPLVNDAIRSYQAVHGLPVNGLPSESLLAHMLSGGEEVEEFGSRP